VNDRRFFRALVCCDAALLVAEVVSSATITAPDAPMDAESNPTILLLSLFVAVGAVVSLVGLWRFWAPARPLYVTVLLIAIGLVAVIPGASTSASGLESAISSLGTLVAGMVIALMYFSPVSVEFERQTPEAEQKTV
jgi:hypothetical protein